MREEKVYNRVGRMDAALGNAVAILRTSIVTDSETSTSARAAGI